MPQWPTQQPAPQWPTQQPVPQWPAPQPGMRVGHPAPTYPVHVVPGYYQPPRPKGGAGLRALLFAIIGVIVILGFLITLSSYLSDDYEDPWPSPSPAPTEPTPEPPQPDPTTVPEPDLSPPDLPEPTTYTEATEWMESNLVYAESTRVPTECVVKPVGAKASADQLEEHLNELTACLWLVWDPPLTRAGFELPRPPVTVYSSSITTRCGKIDDVNAVYCGGDQRIYYSIDVLESLPSSVRSAPFVADAVVAHEFGHAIQARTGILISETLHEQRSTTTKSKALDLSRRLEQQADCFSGMFTNAVASANGLDANELKTLQTLFYNFGDDVLSGDPGYVGNHGSGAARKRWFTAGETTDQLQTCNAFVAKASEVK